MPVSSGGRSSAITAGAVGASGSVVMGRDWIGSFKEAEDLGRDLDRWIHNYVSADQNPSEDVRARLPLREARVEVRPVPGRAGAYNAIVWLRPWLQLEELTASMRMVASIPQKRG